MSAFARLGVKLDLSIAYSFCSSFLASFSMMSFNLFRSCQKLSIILLYDKEPVSGMLCSLSETASRVACTGADTALYKFAILFLIQLVMLIYTKPPTSISLQK